MAQKTIVYDKRWYSNYTRLKLNFILLNSTRLLHVTFSCIIHFYLFKCYFLSFIFQICITWEHALTSNKRDGVFDTGPCEVVFFFFSFFLCYFTWLLLYLEWKSKKSESCLNKIAIISIYIVIFNFYIYIFQNIALSPKILYTKNYNLI